MESKPPVRYRKLRIAWSVACSVVAVLLCVLWVRSYWRADWIGYNYEVGYGFAATSDWGRLGFSSYDGRNYTGINRIQTTGFYLKSFADSIPAPHDRMWGYGFKGLHEPSTYLLVPHWFLVLLASLISVVGWAPAIGLRFSLRTLLIATTLVAVGLGLFVWAARK